MQICGFGQGKNRCLRCRSPIRHAFPQTEQILEDVSAQKYLPSTPCALPENGHFFSSRKESFFTQKRRWGCCQAKPSELQARARVAAACRRAAAVTWRSGSWMNCRHRAGTVALAGDMVPFRVRHMLCHTADGPGCWRDRGEGEIRKHPENSGKKTLEQQRSAAPITSLHPGDECTKQAALSRNRGR